LTSTQVSQVEEIFDTDDDDRSVAAYERRMAALIGDGNGVSFAAGRMAFYALLKALGVGEGDEVILLGFTCSVMVNAVWRSGARPVFADIDESTFGSDAKDILKKITDRTKVIVVQHSFGIPCNMLPIVGLGRKYNIFVVEDCAITLDSSINGVKVGNWGDAAIFSTDHSKPMNTLIGGFLYTRNDSLYKKVKEFSSDLPHLNKAHQKRLFDQFLYEREYYLPEHYRRTILIDYVRQIKRRFALNPQEVIFLDADYTRQSFRGIGYPYPAKMPSFLAQIGLFELDRWPQEREKRKNLLKGYLNIANQTYFKQYLPKVYTYPNLDIVPHRFVFTHPNSEYLMKIMNRFIDVNWTWFRSPIICTPEGPESLGYEIGSCAIAERVGQSIINWPCILPEDWDLKIIEIFKTVINDKN
jgi:perosamine synthetase